MLGRALSPDKKKLRVLLISEDAVDARWIKQMLGPSCGGRGVRYAGFVLNHVDGISAAVDIFAHRHFDAVLLDLGLPSKDELRLISKIIAAMPDLPIIALTGFSDTSITLRAIAFGAQECLFKETLEADLLKRTILHSIARKANESKHSVRTKDFEDFTYIASHDLKEPLRGISSYCEILLEDYRHKLDADGKRRLTTAIHLCDHTENLIDDLLTYCRIGMKTSKVTRVNLTSAAENIMKVFRPAIERRGAVVKISETLPTVSGNPTLIGMVLSNLISNGLKFNESRRPRIEVGWLAGHPPVFYVKDNGIGIAKDYHEAIFTIFRRLHGRKKYEGTGAGLTIVRKIVELHGGRIWLESAPGEGTTFFFTLCKSAVNGGNEHQLQAPHWVERKRPVRVPARLRVKQNSR
jgi:signal transduction histidine kinase